MNAGVIMRMARPPDNLAAIKALEIASESEQPAKPRKQPPPVHVSTLLVIGLDL